MPGVTWKQEESGKSDEGCFRPDMIGRVEGGGENMERR